MRTLFIVITIFILAWTIQGQQIPEIDDLEVISIDNIHDLELLEEFDLKELDINAIHKIHFNSDASRLIVIGNSGLIYIDLDTAKTKTIFDRLGEFYGDSTHPSDPNLMIFNGNLINIETGETILDYPNSAELFTEDGNKVISITTLSDAETGEVIEQWHEPSNRDEYPRQFFWGFDASSNGETIGLIGMVERENCCPYSHFVVRVVKDFEEWISYYTEPYGDERENFIRVSNDGAWIAYLAHYERDHERRFSIVLYSVEEPDIPIYTDISGYDFEFDYGSTMLVGWGWVFSIGQQEYQELSLPEYYRVEFSRDGTLMVTVNSSIQIWGVPISSDTE